MRYRIETHCFVLEVARLIKLNPKFIYIGQERPPHHQRCMYASGVNCSGCLFGQVLHNLGVPVHILQDWDDTEAGAIRSALQDERLSETLSPQLFNWAECIQTLQDRKHSWGYAMQESSQHLPDVWKEKIDKQWMFSEEQFVAMTVGLAREFPDVVYEKCQPDNTCLYSQGGIGNRGCLFGRVFRLLGVDPHAVEKCDVHGEDSTITISVALGEYTSVAHEVRVWANELQGNQDRQVPWEEAVRQANSFLPARYSRYITTP